MNIIKELLDSLGVVSSVLVSGGTDNMCFISRQSDSQWNLRLQAKPENLHEGDRALLIISFTDSVREENEVTVTELGEDYCSVTIPGNQENRKTLYLVRKFRDLEYKDEQFGHRKETRIAIGKENAAAFSLVKPEQQFYLPTIKNVQPCVIKDASIHGICVITPYVNEIRNSDIFNVVVNFRNPQENVLLKIHKVHIRLNKTSENNIIATLSCQLLEPIHYAWKERVIALLCKNENTGGN